MSLHSPGAIVEPTRTTRDRRAPSYPSGDISSPVPIPLVIASSNPHQVQEFRQILAPLAADFTVLGLADLNTRGAGPFHEPEETGSTFEHNAAIKALSYAAQTGMNCLADDSGLEIDALGGKPGVISSHYFNDGRTDGPAATMSRLER